MKSQTCGFLMIFVDFYWKLGCPWWLAGWVCNNMQHHIQVQLFLGKVDVPKWNSHPLKDFINNVEVLQRVNTQSIPPPQDFQPSRFHLAAITWWWQLAMAGVGVKRERAKMRSKQWSCSELVDGHAGLVASKKEKESDDELSKEIKDPLHCCNNSSILLKPKR